MRGLISLRADGMEKLSKQFSKRVRPFVVVHKEKSVAWDFVGLSISLPPFCDIVMHLSGEPQNEFAAAAFFFELHADFSRILFGKIKRQLQSFDNVFTPWFRDRFGIGIKMKFRDI